jgi:transposase
MFFSSNTEVYIYREAVDMRKGHDGLSSIVETRMNLELLSGAIFLFVNKSRRLCKALYFDGSGLIIIHKRMEVGIIMNFLSFGEIQKITISELALIMDGATLRIHQRGKKYQHGSNKKRPSK